MYGACMVHVWCILRILYGANCLQCDYHDTNDYAYGDPFNMNDPSNQLQFTQSLKTVQFRRYLQAVQHIDTADNPADLLTKPLPFASYSKHRTTLMNLDAPNVSLLSRTVLAFDRVRFALNS